MVRDSDLPRGPKDMARTDSRSGKNKSITTGWVNLIDEKDMPRLTPWEFQLAHIMHLGQPTAHVVGRGFFGEGRLLGMKTWPERSGKIWETGISARRGWK